MVDLVNFDRIRAEIDAAKDINVLVKMSDKLEAMRVWAKQSKQSLEVQNSVAEYRLRVERKIGGWLDKNIRKPEEGRPPEVSTDSTLLLKDVGLSRDASSKAQLINKLSDEQFEELIEHKKALNQEVTLSEAVRVAKQIIRGEKIEEAKNQILKNNLTQPQGTYDVIVIDPPWSMSEEYDPNTYMGRVAVPYPTMTQEQLLQIKIPAKENCILWLWTTNIFIRDAFELLDEWGFEQKTILTWNKVNMGVGYYLRNVTEHCILATKGKPLWTNKTHTTLITEKRTTHSTKPEAFYKMVDEICVGRKLDYFARTKREGWDVYGNEVEEEK